jgi:carbohydrate kinase (thermoresistant glucokinase family)
VGHDVARVARAAPDTTTYGVRMAVVVMGVSGSGKTSVARLVAEALGADMVDADDLHPEENVAKMAAGTALTDDDRWPWLDRVTAAMREGSAAGRDVVVACSALRRGYRDVLRTGADGVVFVLLDVPREDLDGRLRQRKGHFMPATLLDSQLSTLEPFSPGDEGLVVDASGPARATGAAVLEALLPARP